MNHGPSSIASRISSNKSTVSVSRNDGKRVQSFLIGEIFPIILITFAVVGCGVSSREPLARTESRPSPPDRRGDIVEADVRAPVPLPPWQVWSEDTFDDPNIAQAQLDEARGDLESAVRAYERTVSSATVRLVREEALLRELGTLLKLGRSAEVLSRMTDYVNREGIRLEELGPQFALVVAFAYEHERDFDQTLAWLAAAHRKARPGGIVRERAEGELVRLIAGIGDQMFLQIAQTWSREPLVNSIFERERARRQAGGKAELRKADHWFQPSTYLPGATTTGITSPATSTSGTFVVGVLLPLSGQFAQFGERVKQGIELAARSAPPETYQFVYRDTQGDPQMAASEYEALVNQFQARVILGPLLVRTTEAVAGRAYDLKVPFISFTKRQGVAELGPAVFRLGVTAENQAEELTTFLIDELGKRAVATIFPATAASEELAMSFRKAIEVRKGQVVLERGYDLSDPNASASLITELERVKPEVIFLPDSLENSLPIIEALKQSSLADIPLVGSASWDDPVALRGMVKLLEGSIFVTPFFAQSVKPIVAEFSSQFLENYGRAPELLSAQGYDAASWVLANVDPSNPDVEAVLKSLESADSRIGVTGKLVVNPAGDIKRRMSIIQVRGGELVEVMSAGVETGYILDEAEQKKDRSELSQ